MTAFCTAQRKKEAGRNYSSYTASANGSTLALNRGMEHATLLPTATRRLVTLPTLPTDRPRSRSTTPAPNPPASTVGLQNTSQPPRVRELSAAEKSAAEEMAIAQDRKQAERQLMDYLAEELIPLSPGFDIVRFWDVSHRRRSQTVFLIFIIL